MKTIKGEKWSRVESYDNEIARQYLISNFGRVYSVSRQRMLKAMPTNRSFLYVHLFVKGKKVTAYIHKLVAEHFVSRNDSGKKMILFKDNNNQNCKASNLVWVYPSPMLSVRLKNKQFKKKKKKGEK